MTTTPGLDRQLIEMFTQEVIERSSELERNLLRIEETAELDEKRQLQDRLLRTAHSLKGAAGLVEIRPVEAICHAMEDLLALAAREDRVLTDSEMNLLLGATDAIAQAGRMLEKGERPSGPAFDAVLKQLGGKPRQNRRPPLSAPMSVPPPRGDTGSLAEIRASDIDGSMRLSGDRLDSLLLRSGELLVSRSRIRLRAGQAIALREQARQLHPDEPISAELMADLQTGLRKLAADLSEDGRLLHSSTVALDQEVRRVRVLPFSEACQGLARIVRDMGAEAGKSASFDIRGGDVDIDRSIVAGLRDALRHLVRNAIGHGIEPPEERRAAGKPEAGTITVSARLSGDNLRVRVEDDGRGLDIASITRAAVEMGLPAASDERQQLRQALEPGVSTSSAVTRLSGRGIGLDIVRNAVEGMRGTVDVSHKAGSGARFTLTLPLTLATVRAMEVMAGGQTFVIDTASVHRVARIRAEDLPAPGAPNRLVTEKGSMHVIELAAWLGLPAMGQRTAGDLIPAIIIGPAGSETAVLVEDVAHEQELLARSLGPRLSKIRYYSGGTVLPDGRVALLLNAAALVEAARANSVRHEEFGYDGPVAPRRVLVVDDSLSIRTLERLILEAAGYEVAMAADGNEAWQHLEAHGADIVIADVDMPAMDGFTLTRTIRGSEQFKNLPVILITGRDTPEDKARGMDVGANAYMAKTGFDQQQFLDMVRQLG